METKICKVCHAEKPFDEFTKHKACKNGLLSRCKRCTQKYQREWALKNPTKVANVKKKYLESNPQKRAETCRKYAEKNKDIIYEKNKQRKKDFPEKYRDSARKYDKKNRENLGDSYLRSILSMRSNLSAKDIPAELVEIKRLQLAINRELKKGKNHEKCT